jgi:uncharacterized membrane protein YphA (DoxX/SURF4 family)
MNERRFFLWRPGYQWVLRVVLAGIMLYAALPKLVDWEADPIRFSYEPFARMVYNYRVLPVSLTNLAAFTLPFVETFGALCLLTGFWLRAGSLMLAILQTAFLLGMAQAWARDLDIECGCFVGVDSKVGLWTMLRDSLFLVGFILVYLGTFRSAAPEPEPDSGTVPSTPTEEI